MEESKQKHGFKQKLGYIKSKARSLKREVTVLYLACRRPDTPILAKLLGIIVVGYALSPIDLIPDFIPVLGYLDDLLLIPLGVWLTIKLIPENILDECRAKAQDAFREGKPKNWTAAVVIILIWAAVIGLIIYKIFIH